MAADYVIRNGENEVVDIDDFFRHYSSTPADQVITTYLQDNGSTSFPREDTGRLNATDQWWGFGGSGTGGRYRYWSASKLNRDFPGIADTYSVNNALFLNRGTNSTITPIDFVKTDFSNAFPDHPTTVYEGSREISAYGSIVDMSYDSSTKKITVYRRGLGDSDTVVLDGSWVLFALVGAGGGGSAYRPTLSALKSGGAGGGGETIFGCLLFNRSAMASFELGIPGQAGPYGADDNSNGKNGGNSTLYVGATMVCRAMGGSGGWRFSGGAGGTGGTAINNNIVGTDFNYVGMGGISGGAGSSEATENPARGRDGTGEIKRFINFYSQQNCMVRGGMPASFSSEGGHSWYQYSDKTTGLESGGRGIVYGTDYAENGSPGKLIIWQWGNG